MNIFPALDTVLLLAILGMMLWRFRVLDLSDLWDEIEAIKLRLNVQEKTAPCPPTH